MAIGYFFSFFLLPTIVKGAESECYAGWLGGKLPPISECSLLKGTLTVPLKNLFERPECLKMNTGVGIKINQEKGWDSRIQLKNIGQNLTRDTVVVFSTTKSLCSPVNLTVGLNFWSRDGNKFVTHRVKSELDPITCIDENLSDNEKNVTQTKCPNLTLDTMTTTTATTETFTEIEHVDVSERKSGWNMLITSEATAETNTSE